MTQFINPFFNLTESTAKAVRERRQIRTVMPATFAPGAQQNRINTPPGQGTTAAKVCHNDSNNTVAKSHSSRLPELAMIISIPLGNTSLGSNSAMVGCYDSKNAATGRAVQ